jgi:hypothetical protein
MDRTMARKKAEPSLIPPGLNPAAFTPPGPGLMMPVSASPRPTTISKQVITTSALMLIEMPR